MNKVQKTIALDADGVLLDYNHAYGKIWTLSFDEILEIKEPNAYHATRYWGVENPAKDHLFWDNFDKHGWTNMQAMEGSVDACNRLVSEGYRLVCVTSMPEHRATQRLENLQRIGFPIDEVIATGTPSDKTINPKKLAIEKLLPDWFVDDELRKLKQLPKSVKCVLIDPIHVDSPNFGQDDSYLNMRVKNLLEFSNKIALLHKSTNSNKKKYII